MSNPNPTPIQKPGFRDRLDPNEKTITRTMSLPESWWRKLDAFAQKASEQEYSIVTAQEIIRRCLVDDMETVLQKIVEGKMLREMSKIFGKYNLELKVIPKHRSKKNGDS
jgi:hypothetical protein